MFYKSILQQTNDCILAKFDLEQLEVNSRLHINAK